MNAPLKAPPVTADDLTTPPDEPRRRTPPPVWIALGVAALLALVSLMSIVHRPGVPTLEPGHKGMVRMSGSN